MAVVEVSVRVREREVVVADDSRAFMGLVSPRRLYFYCSFAGLWSTPFPEGGALVPQCELEGVVLLYMGTVLSAHKATPAIERLWRVAVLADDMVVAKAGRVFVVGTSRTLVLDARSGAQLLFLDVSYSSVLAVAHDGAEFLYVLDKHTLWRQSQRTCAREAWLEFARTPWPPLLDVSPTHVILGQRLYDNRRVQIELGQLLRCGAFPLPTFSRNKDSVFSFGGQNVLGLDGKELFSQELPILYVGATHLVERGPLGFGARPRPGLASPSKEGPSIGAGDASPRTLQPRPVCRKL